MVEDADHHKDSITDAFRQAELLNHAVGDHIHDPSRLDERLARYAFDWTAAMADGYRSTLTLAA